MPETSSCNRTEGVRPAGERRVDEVSDEWTTGGGRPGKAYGEGPGHVPDRGLKRVAGALRRSAGGCVFGSEEQWTSSGDRRPGRPRRGGCPGSGLLEAILIVFGLVHPFVVRGDPIG